MRLYRIRRKSDSKFYRGKSKFTSHGTFFRLQQIKGNIKWVKSQNDDIEIIVYNISESLSIDMDNLDLDDLARIIDRDSKINSILDN